MNRLTFTGWPEHSGRWVRLVALWRSVGAVWRRWCRDVNGRPCLRCLAQRSENRAPGRSIFPLAPFECVCCHGEHVKRRRDA